MCFLIIDNCCIVSCQWLQVGEYSDFLMPAFSTCWGKHPWHTDKLWDAYWMLPPFLRLFLPSCFFYQLWKEYSGCLHYLCFVVWFVSQIYEYINHSLLSAESNSLLCNNNGIVSVSMNKLNEVCCCLISFNTQILFMRLICQPPQPVSVISDMTGETLIHQSYRCKMSTVML